MRDHSAVVPMKCCCCYCCCCCCCCGSRRRRRCCCYYCCDYCLLSFARAGSDFEAGKSHLAYVLEMKFNAWQKLPLRLCGLGLPANEQLLIQEIAKDCLQQYVCQPDPKLHHRVSSLFCAPGAPLYNSVVAVANGESLQAHVELQRAVQILKLIPVAEHVIEGPRASTQRQVLRAPRCGPVAVSMALRGPEIEEFVSHGPIWASMVLSENLENLDRISSLQKALPELGLDSHPAVALAQKSGRLSNGLVCNIIFRCDPDSQFMSLREANMTLTSAKKLEKQRREQCEQKRDKKFVARDLQTEGRPDWLFQQLLFDCLRAEEHVFFHCQPRQHWGSRSCRSQSRAQ